MPQTPLIVQLANASLVERWLLGDAPSFAAQFMLSVGVILLVFIPVVLLLAMLSIWMERKVAGHIQSRFGPNRVGPIGLFQSLADGIKLLVKEDLVPRQADAFLYRIAPYVVFAPVFAALMAIPFGPDFIFAPGLSVGLFWILAVLGLEVMGVILAGWSSNNKWSLYGAMREACQMVSYEIPLGLAIIVAVMSAGTLNLLHVGQMQGGGMHTWIAFSNPFVFAAFFTYFVASLASNKRAPFDLPESESELVAGFHTEYSGMRFAFFFFAEYAAMWIIAWIQVALFLGAWHDPFGLLGYYRLKWAGDTNALMLLNVIGAMIFMLKALGLVFVQMWLRWTLPRPRIDQVLYACVKVLLPLACVLLLGAAVWQIFAPATPGVPWRDYNPFSFAELSAASNAMTAITQITLAIAFLLLILAIKGWVLVAWLKAGGQRDRISPVPTSTGGAA